jgi:serine/threonine-protein kinase
MAKVYKAFDPQLGRHVALKVLRGGAGPVERFLREARAQARVEHPNVCAVYEAGQVDGEPFIAMQLIAGQTLRDAAPAMSLEHRVGAMLLVAEGLHAAHRQGLIHRDVKPTNIMVVRGETSGWTPYVMDFGLAHLEDVAQTTDGAVLGTPAYMAPEQARGESARADRRTDVYGLGATLYHVLLGRVPFEGESVSSLLLKILRDDPPPPRSLDPSVPRDLETIILKCLEKEPQRRYESARALAEDLRRFLDGEPVAARPAGALHRLGRKARKHKAVAAALAVSASVVVGAAGLLARESWRAATRERLASRYAEVGRDMEAVMERSRLLPLHDVTYARALVQQRMAALRAEMADAGDLALGPGRHALGRGLLALGDYGGARRELEAAWEGHGVREKGVAYALGLALVELYRLELAAVQRLPNPDARRERLAQIDQGLRQPALRRLREGREAGASPEYAEALLAFLDRDYARAIEKAREAEDRSPWLYVASVLAGDAWVGIGAAHRDQGRGAEARRAFAEAGRFYRAAVSKGGSDPRCYEGIAQLRLDEIYMDLVQATRPRSAAFAEAEAACRRALTADPHRAAAWSLLSSVLFRLGQDLAARGEDAAASYREAIAAGEKAVSLDPEDERSFKSLGDSSALFALYEYQFDRPATLLLQKAVDAYRAAIRIAPRNPALHSNLGNALDLVPAVKPDSARAARDGYRKEAEACFREAVRLGPSESDYWNNLGTNLLKQGQDRVERAEDPTRLFEEAALTLREAARLNPENTSAYNNLGFTYELLGDYEMRRTGRDPRPAFEKAEAAFGEYLRRKPDGAVAWRNLGDTLAARALYERSTGAGWPPALERARRAFREALRFNSEDYSTWTSLQSAWCIEAEARLSSGEDAGKALAGAEAALRRAEALAPDAFEVWIARSEVDRLRAARDAARGRDPEPRFASAETAARRAAALDPDGAEAPLAAAQVLEQRVAWQLARRPAGVATTAARGVAAARRALALAPGEPTASARLASLLEMQSRGEDVDRRARRREARDLLRQALERRPSLAREYASLARTLGLR